MKKLVEIKDVSIEKEGNKVLDKISFSLYEGINTFICGTPSSGKTMLLKTIKGCIKYKGHILKDSIVEVVLEEENFRKDTILEELDFENLDETQKKIINKFLTKKVLENNPLKVNHNIKKTILLCKALLKQPQVLIVDNLFSYLDKKMLDKIYSYTKKNKITIVNVSTNIEEALYYDYMVVLDKGRIAIEGKTLQVLEQEKLLKRLGIGLPFYVDLSIQLRLYGLIEKIYLTKEELEGALWK